MTGFRSALALGVAAATLGATTSRAFDSDHDTGWGAPYNSHLDSYSGRPLGPPLATLPPGYQYYNGRLIWVPPAGIGSRPIPYAVPRHAVRPNRVMPRASRRR